MKADLEMRGKMSLMRQKSEQMALQNHNSAAAAAQLALLQLHQQQHNQSLLNPFLHNVSTEYKNNSWLLCKWRRKCPITECSEMAQNIFFCEWGKALKINLQNTGNKFVCVLELKFWTLSFEWVNMKSELFF